MTSPTDSEIKQALENNLIYNPCVSGSNDFTLWNTGFVIGAKGQFKNGRPALLEGIEAGQKWRSDLMGNSND